MTKERMSGAISPNYQAPVIKVVSFLIEKGYNYSIENISQGQDISGSDDNTNTTGSGIIRWE